jgi:multiple sugar transport system permease protein
VRGGRTVMNLALFTYFIPAAFLAVPMYKTMGNYGLLNNQWALILAMVTIASPYCIWVLKQAVRQAALGTGRSRAHGRRQPAAAVPAGLPAADGARRWWRWAPTALLLAWNEYLYAFLLLSKDNRRHAGGGAGQLPVGRRFALGTADGHRPGLRRCRPRPSTTPSSATWSAASPPAP